MQRGKNGDILGQIELRQLPNQLDYLFCHVYLNLPIVFVTLADYQVSLQHFRHNLTPVITFFASAK